MVVLKRAFGLSGMVLGDVAHHETANACVLHTALIGLNEEEPRNERHLVGSMSTREGILSHCRDLWPSSCGQPVSSRVSRDGNLRSDRRSLCLRPDSRR